ncbi:MAG: response regulator transcription factor [Saprospiraceae bacterium]|nr:response regulator transcription factor [Candidatus Vicinibacter affinis]
MNKLRILIVEDEILIAETIRLYLQEYGHETSAICISYEEAIEKYHLHLPDLILLDIRLFGDKSGIDMANYLNTLDDKPPYIYLTSQYDKRILDLATQTLPYGYITKPFVKETLWTSIETSYALHKSQLVTESKINIAEGRSNHLVSVNDILYLKSDHVYLEFYLKNGNQLLSRSNIENYLNKLEAYGFLKCHRSYVVNTNHITSWNKEALILTGGQMIPISKMFKEDVMKRIEEIIHNNRSHN